jgi:hypothetical protein
LSCDKELENTRKLRYYNEVVNPNLENKKYLYILISIKNKINIAKIRKKTLIRSTVKRDIGQFAKMLWVKRTCHLCYIMKVEDEKYFLLKCPTYTHIKSHFQNICYNINLIDFLTHQNCNVSFHQFVF